MCTAPCFDGGGCCMLSLLLHVICVFIGKQSLSDCWIGLALILLRRQSVGAQGGEKVRTPDRKTTMHVNGHAGAREVQPFFNFNLPPAFLFSFVKLERTLIENGQQQPAGGSRSHLKWMLGVGPMGPPVKMPILVRGPLLHEDILNSWSGHMSWFQWCRFHYRSFLANIALPPIQARDDESDCSNNQYKGFGEVSSSAFIQKMKIEVGVLQLYADTFHF